LVVEYFLEIIQLMSKRRDCRNQDYSKAAIILFNFQVQVFLQLPARVLEKTTDPVSP